MADEAQFRAAAAAVQALPTDPGTDTKLRLYALYKQATEGDANGGRPGFTNPVGRAKYDAWAAVAGMDAAAARAAYVELAGSLTG
ncbi:MAG: acyl-CoA-binding protein [Dermatophilaceae bacterium]